MSVYVCVGGGDDGAVEGQATTLGMCLSKRGRSHLACWKAEHPARTGLSPVTRWSVFNNQLSGKQTVSIYMYITLVCISPIQLQTIYK